MEQRWFLPGDELLADPLPTGILRLFRNDWDHDCLDVDVGGGSATHRSQKSSKTDSPEHWDASTRGLRRDGEHWEVEISNADIGRWIQDQSALIQRKKDFSVAHPQFDIREEIKNAEDVLCRLRGLTAGWNALAADVGNEIDAWQANLSDAGP